LRLDFTVDFWYHRHIRIMLECFDMG